MYVLNYYWENSEIYFLRCLHIYRNIYYVESHTLATRTEDSKSKQRVDIIWFWPMFVFYPQLYRKQVSFEQLTKYVICPLSPVGPLGPVVYGFPHFTGLDSRKLEHKWKTMDRWQKWRSYSCPTNDLLADLIQEQDNKVVNNGCLVLPLLSIPTLSLANKAKWEVM